MIIAIIKNSLKYQLPKVEPVNQPVNLSKKVILNSPHGINPTIITRKVIPNNTKVILCLIDNLISLSSNFSA